MFNRGKSLPRLLQAHVMKTLRKLWDVPEIMILLMFVLIMERRIDNSCPLTFILSPKMGERGG
jgi:hypothetical protein